MSICVLMFFFSYLEISLDLTNIVPVSVLNVFPFNADWLASQSQ